MSQPELPLSVILATHNRRDVVAKTIARVRDCGLAPAAFEIIVVDNASSDGTGEMLRDHRGVRVLRLPENLGSCAKGRAVSAARGEFLLFLDDDSFPRAGSAAQMLEHFAAEPRLGAAAFRVHLPDGRQEGSALPHVFVGCGVGLRAAAVRQVGGLDVSFFMQAEEYDLSFRLLAAGWSVRAFDDLHVEHLKTRVARQTERTTYFDVRNNLRLIARYLPDQTSRVYRHDWLRRYAWLAHRSGTFAAFGDGVRDARIERRRERQAYHIWRLRPDVLEAVFCWEQVCDRMHALRASGVRQIVLADLGKNIYPFWRGARKAGIRVLGIADERFAVPERAYRGTPIVPWSVARVLRADAYVVSNTSSVHAAARAEWLAARGATPVHAWLSAAATAFATA